MTTNVASPVRLLLTPPEAAKALSVSTRTLWSLTNSGEIGHVKIGRLVRYSLDDLQAFIETRKAAVAAEPAQ